MFNELVSTSSVVEERETCVSISDRLTIRGEKQTPNVFRQGFTMRLIISLKPERD